MTNIKALLKQLDENIYLQITIIFGSIFLIISVANYIFEWNLSTFIILLSTLSIIFFVAISAFVYDYYTQLSNKNSVKWHSYMLNVIKIKSIFSFKKNLDAKVDYLQHISIIRQRRINSLRGLIHKMNEGSYKKEKNLKLMKRKQFDKNTDLIYQRRIKNRFYERELKEVEINKMKIMRFNELLTSLLIIQKITNHTINQRSKIIKGNTSYIDLKNETLEIKLSSLDTILKINVSTPLKIKYTKISSDNYEINNFENLYSKVYSSAKKIKDLDKN